MKVTEAIKETNKIYNICKDLGLTKETYDTNIRLLSSISDLTSELPQVFFETERKLLRIQFGHKLNNLDFSINHKVVKVKNRSTNIDFSYDGKVSNDKLKELLEVSAN